MVREICRDEAFLAQKAEPATKDDLVRYQIQNRSEKDIKYCQIPNP